MLYGREHELGILGQVVGKLADRSGTALVIRGEPGAGKTALLAEATTAARQQGSRVLSVACVRPESQIPFAALHRLLQPLLPAAAGLPDRHRSALLAAFGLSDLSADPLLTSLGALELLGGDQPTLCVVDDAQWLDDASRSVLSLVARRLTGQSCAMLVAVCDGHLARLADVGLDELPLGAIADSPARELLDSRAPGLDPALRDRVLAAAAGNPLALAELPKALPEHPKALPEHPSDRLRLTGRLIHAFAAREATLPSATQTVLLVAAADPDAALAQVLAAASRCAGRTVDLDAVTPAVDAGLAEVRHHQLAFRHPLQASATYQAVTDAQRQAAHAALADVLAAQPDRQVWHQAQAALGPDERVATRLDEAARRAERRGAFTVAASALDRAAELSADEGSRGARLLRAAELAFDVGHPELGPQLLKAAEPLELPEEARARLLWLRQAGSGWPAQAQVSTFISMADRMRSDGHQHLAAQALHTAALRCWWSSPDQQARAAIGIAAERIRLAPDEPILLAVRACADPIRHAADITSRVARAVPDVTDPAGMYLTGAAATAVWAHDLSLGYLELAVHGLREQGRRGLLAQALVAQSWAAVHLARGRLADAASAEAASLARETGQLRWVIGAQLAMAAAVAERGDLDVAEPLIRDAEALLTTAGANSMLALAQFVRGRGAVARQRYGQAAAQLRRTLDPSDPAYHQYIGAWGLADLVEANVQTGETAAARAYLAELDSLASSTQAPLLRAQAAYARPMLADDRAAETLYRTALDQELIGWPGYRARMLLAYGRWLRRQRRIADSRVPLRTARESFEALDFHSLAQCAHHELRASGERSKGAPPGQLTAQELQIAQLAADGLSNREIGQRLFISHRTVGYHLHRIFPKLGITSRSQLHAALNGLSFTTLDHGLQWTTYANGHSVDVALDTENGVYSAGGDSVQFRVVPPEGAVVGDASVFDLATMKWRHFVLPAGVTAEGIFGNSVIAAQSTDPSMLDVVSYASNGTATTLPITGLPSGAQLLPSSEWAGDASSVMLAYTTSSGDGDALLDLATGAATPIPLPNGDHRQVLLTPTKIGLYDITHGGVLVYSRANLTVAPQSAVVGDGVAVALIGDVVISAPELASPCEGFCSPPTSVALAQPLMTPTIFSLMPITQAFGQGVVETSDGTALLIGGTSKANYAVRKLEPSLTSKVVLPLTSPVSNGGLTISRGLVRHIEVVPTLGSFQAHRLFNHPLARSTSSFDEPAAISVEGGAIQNPVPCAPGSECTRTVDGNQFGLSYLAPADNAHLVNLEEQQDIEGNTVGLSLRSADGTTNKAKAAPGRYRWTPSVRLAGSRTAQPAGSGSLLVRR